MVVFVISATNRIDMVDPALMMPGRIDRLTHIPVHDKDTISKIFDIHLKGKPVSAEVSLRRIAEAIDEHPGTETDAVCMGATMLALACCDA